MVIFIIFSQHFFFIIIKTHVRKFKLSSSKNGDQYFPAYFFKVWYIFSDVRKNFESKEYKKTLAFHEIIFVTIGIDKSWLFISFLKQNQLLLKQIVNSEHYFL